MICVFDKSATDFTTNGLGLVLPVECTVTETLNGTWELTMKHPLDGDGKWRRLRRGNIVRAPVPAAMTPALSASATAAETREIWRVATNGGRLRLRSGTGTKYRIIGKYKNGAKVVLLDKTTSAWYKVAAPDGKQGYMAAAYLRYVRTETVPGKQEAENEVIEPRQLRDQPFRIYRVVPGLDGITVYARHIFYDLADNLVREYSPKEAIGSTVAANILTKCEDEHLFTMASDLDAAGSAEWTNANPVDMLLGDAGLMETWRGELARDWFDVYAVQRVGKDSGVTVRQGKNVTGLTVDEDESNVVTRVVPVGQDKDGRPLYLPELSIESPHAASYANLKWKTLDVSEAKEVTKGNGRMTKKQCYAKLRQAAQAELDAGCDLPDITIQVDFVNLPDTVEGKELAALNRIYLGDTVRVFCERLGLAVAMRMTDYTYDCVGRRYTKMSLGTVANGLERVTISAKQFASASIPGAKLMLGSVGTGQLRDLAVDTAKIQVAAIATAHIQNAAITSALVHEAAITTAHIADAAITKAKISEAAIGALNAEAITAMTARIKELAAGSVTTDELYAAFAGIAVAQLTTANIGAADIEWAQITSLTATAAAIANARIENAQILSAQITDLSATVSALAKAQITAADIDWAEIANLMASVANVADARIARAQITAAQIADLSATIAGITAAQIGSASIGFGQIRDLAAGTAIIQKGVNGKLYVADLAVTEANMASLTVGELLVRGADGGFYALVVGENGAVSTERKRVADADVQDASLSGGKLLENTVTARELNVASIFASDALIGAITSANIDVAELFAAQATIDQLTAVDIRGNEFLRLAVADELAPVESDLADHAENIVSLLGRMREAELSLTSEKLYAAVKTVAQFGQDLEAVRQAALSLTREEFKVTVEQARNADGELKKMSSYFRFLEDGMHISKSDSDYDTVYGDAGYETRESGKVVSRVRGGRLEILDAAITESCQMMNFLWKSTSDGGLGLFLA